MSGYRWAAILLLSGLAWFDPHLRQAVTGRWAVHLALGVVCGLASVFVKHFDVGKSRRLALIALFVMCWGITIGWQYFVDRNRFDLPLETIYGLGISLIPVTTAAFYSSYSFGNVWTVVQVAGLSLVAAPFTSLLALVLMAVIGREGP